MRKGSGASASKSKGLRYGTSSVPISQALLIRTGLDMAEAELDKDIEDDDSLCKFGIWNGL